MKRRIWCVAGMVGSALFMNPIELNADRDIGAQSASAQVRFVIVIPRLLTVTRRAEGSITARSNDGPLVLSNRQRTRVGMQITPTLTVERAQASSGDWVIATP